MAQARKKNSDSKPLGAHVVRGLREGALFIFSTLGIYFLVILSTYHQEDPGWTNSVTHEEIANAGGRVGAWFADVLLLLFGFLAYLVPVMIAYSGWLLYRGRTPGGEFDARLFSLRFGGFLMTDDISMKALSGTVAERGAAARAAGCDAVLHCNGDLEEMRALMDRIGPLDEAGQRRAEAALAARGQAAPVDIAAARAEFESLIP